MDWVVHLRTHYKKAIQKIRHRTEVLTADAAADEQLALVADPRYEFKGSCPLGFMFVQFSQGFVFGSPKNRMQICNARKFLRSKKSELNLIQHHLG